jgi:cytoskeletal protein CcmA (bactofilin family)
MWKSPATPSATPGRSNAEAASSSTPTPAVTSSAPESPAAPTPRTISSSASSMDQATIGKSLVIKGELSGSEALYIDGRVEGMINLSNNRVTVGRNGVVNANISAREIVVMGKVKGNLTAQDRVDIRADGSLTGDVIAQRVSIEDGAFFKGGIDIQKAGSPKIAGKPETSASSTPEAISASA